MRGAISQGTWSSGREPILRLITGLGLDRINDFGGDVRR
jgi:hypothetical protein